MYEQYNQEIYINNKKERKEVSCRNCKNKGKSYPLEDCLEGNKRNILCGYWEEK